MMLLPGFPVMFGGGRGPAFVGSAIASNVSGTANSKSVTVSPHANTEVGDLLIMAVSRSGTTNVIPDGMAGWTRITPIGFSGATAALALFYRYRQIGDTSYTTPAIGSSYSVVASLLSFRGAAVGDSEVASTAGAISAVTIPELSSISSGATIVSFFVLGSGTASPPSVTSTPPGSDVVINQAFAQTNSHRLWIGMEQNQPSGPTGDRVLGVSGATQARAVLLEVSA